MWPVQLDGQEPVCLGKKACSNVLISLADTCHDDDDAITTNCLEYEGLCKGHNFFSNSVFEEGR